MRVLLAGPDLEANLSLLYLAASLRSAGHVPVIAPFNGWDDAAAVVRSARAADLVGLSMCFQVRAVEFLELADALKRDAPARPIVAGGHHASCAASELLEHHPALDVIVLHEGEDALVELANLGADLVARAGEVRGVAVRRDGLAVFSPPRPIREDLDGLPRPDRSGPARLLCGVPTAYLMGSRGCVSDCDYCCITTLHRMAPGPRFRQRSPEDVADEMADLYERRGVRQFVFHDDNFLVPSVAHNRERIGSIDAALRSRGVGEVGLVLKCSPRDADRGILEALRGMGLLRLFMGVESASACGLASIGRRQSVEQSERALATCESLGISTQYTLIVFHPEATISSMLADLDFVGRHPAHPLNYCRAEIYSGTPLEARMLAEGRAEGSYLGRTYRYADAKVATVWETGRDLFAGRCWGKDDLLGSVIRMDHQMAVLGRFYEGRRVRALVRSFLAWQVDLNLETAGLFRELVLACGDASGADDPALGRALADLRRREAPAREECLRRLCDYRKALDRYARASVESGRRHAAAPAGGRLRGPRHAAAVAAAIGMLGCAVAHDRGIQEAAPPPVDPRPPPPCPPVPEEAVAPSTGFRPVEGVAEAAPPPIEPPPFRHDLGVAEAAPPPVERVPIEPAPPPFRHDHGVAEAAPPPLDRYKLQTPDWGSIRVRTVPPVPIHFNGRRVEPSSILVIAPGALLVVGDGKGPVPVSAKLRVFRRGPAAIEIRIDSHRPLKVRNGDAEGTAPWHLILPDKRGKHVLVLEDEETCTRLRVELVRLP
jgi:radical SAM superfamily enzyme YgiQ (UPF0313 family)